MTMSRLRKGKTAFRRQRKAGFVLLAVLAFITSIVTLTGTSTTRSLAERSRVTQYVAKQESFYAAEAGIIQGMATVRDRLSITGQFPVASPSGLLTVATPQLTQGATFENFQVTYDVDGNGVADPATQTTLASGQFQGMQATSRTVKVTSEVSTISGMRTHLTSVMTLSVIPVFQFAMFDHNDLKLEPLPLMTVSGAVFSNGALKLLPVTGMTIDGTVGAAGDITHPGNNTGYVRVKDADGVYQNMRNADGSWLESTDSNWAAESQTRWDGKVTAHMAPLQFPVPAGAETIEMIKQGQTGDSTEMRNMRMYYKADIRIMNGVATDKNGNLISLPAGTISTATFYDQREGDEACTTQVDVGKLKDSGLANGKIVYVGSTLANGPSCFNAVRLVNGGQLPSGGLTVVTHHPLYVKGDYNYSTSGEYTKQPAALVGDALTVLSSGWDDAKGTSPMVSRKAVDTHLYAGVMAGRAQDPTTGSEHLVRFLETWTGRTFTFTGSEVSPWESDEASSDLSYASYMPPTRVWSFDTSFITGTPPPGTPVTYTLTNAAWYQE